MERLLALVGDRRNVAGLFGAAAGLGLTFGGLIDAGWWAITAGLYVAGFLAVQFAIPASAPFALQSVPLGELPADLRRLADKVGPQLPAQARLHLSGIVAAAAAIAPKLQAAGGTDLGMIPVRQIMGDYIPTTLSAYLALPARVRSTTKMDNGRTADDQLIDQLALLEKQMDQVVDNLSRGDLIALETQGRFLETKFSSPDVFSA